MHADDTAVLIPFRRNENIYNKVNIDIGNSENWSMNEHFTIHTKKTI